MKKFLLVGLGIGAAAYTIRAAFYLGMIYGQIDLVWKNSHENG